MKGKPKKTEMQLGKEIGKPLLELRDEDVGLESVSTKWVQRRAARCVLRRYDKIALLHVQKHSYHKLPGGGIEKGENAKEALRREVAEEIGSQIEINTLLGHTIEHKSHQDEIQTCVCYLATETGEGIPNFTEEEKNDRFKVEWHSLEKAIELLKNEKPTEYAGKFIIRRELRFLQEAEKHKEFFKH